MGPIQKTLPIREMKTALILCALTIAIAAASHDDSVPETTEFVEKHSELSQAGWGRRRSCRYSGCGVAVPEMAESQTELTQLEAKGHSQAGLWRRRRRCSGCTSSTCCQACGGGQCRL